MQDVFIEYLVKRKNSPLALLLKIGIVLGATLVALIALMFSGYLGSFSMFGALIAVGALYGGYYLLTSMNVEFEYSLTNGELDIDKIIAQRKRKRLVTVKCREAEAFGRYKAAEHQNKTYQTTILACSSPEAEDCWYITARIKDKGLTLIVFNANEKILNGIKPFLPRPIMHEVFRIGNV